MNKKKPTTTRKMKLMGTQDYVNKNTGQIIECQVIEHEERDANFQKIWIGHIASAIEELSNTKMKLVFYILSNADSNNVLIKTIADIIHDTGFSNKTIIDTLKILEKHDIIRRKTGVIFLNPNVLFKGGTKKRHAILSIYHSNSSKFIDAEIIDT